MCLFGGGARCSMLGTGGRDKERVLGSLESVLESCVWNLGVGKAVTFESKLER